MRFWEILEEGRDAPLYHFIHDEWLTMAIHKDQLGLDGQRVSLTRDRRHFFKNAPVMLVLDQKRLAQKYHIHPVAGDAMNAYIRGEEPLRFEQMEAEERIDEPIRPLHRYLMAIVFNKTKLGYIEKRLDNPDWKTDRGTQRFQSIIDWARNNGINVLFR